jgi:hypothetical protein
MYYSLLHSVQGGTVRVYLAANYSRNPEMREIAEMLHASGYFITSRWILGSHEVAYGTVGEATMDKKEAVDFAQEDFSDVMAADIVIHFAKPKGHEGRDRGGRHVELGIALGRGAQVFHVGPKENIFHGLEHVTCYEHIRHFIESIRDESFSRETGLRPQGRHCQLTTADCIRIRRIKETEEGKKEASQITMILQPCDLCDTDHEIVLYETDKPSLYANVGRKLYEGRCPNTGSVVAHNAIAQRTMCETCFTILIGEEVCPRCRALHTT